MATKLDKELFKKNFKEFMTKIKENIKKRDVAK